MIKDLKFEKSKSFLPSPADIATEHPTSSKQLAFIEKTRHTIKQILNQNDPRLLLVIGPCSIHNTDAAKVYAQKLSELAKSLSDVFFIVMRVHLEKPRTATGWKGILYDPNLDGSHDINKGIQLSRRLLLDLAELGLPASTEFLDPLTANYHSDLISWGCIGARTSSSQIHRQMASGLQIPVAFKNNTDGNVDVAIQGAKSAKESHVYMGIDSKGTLARIETQGNPDSHIVLRGGKGKPNYDPHAISTALKSLERNHLPQRVIIDCAHDNSTRQFQEQINVFQSVINQIIQGNDKIKGMMVESYLQGGNQNIPSNVKEISPSISITDPCLDWSSTEQLLIWGADVIRKANQTSCVVSV